MNLFGQSLHMMFWVEQNSSSGMNSRTYNKWEPNADGIVCFLFLIFFLALLWFRCRTKLNLFLYLEMHALLFSLSSVLTRCVYLFVCMFSFLFSLFLFISRFFFVCVLFHKYRLFITHRFDGSHLRDEELLFDFVVWWMNRCRFFWPIYILF